MTAASEGVKTPEKIPPNMIIGVNNPQIAPLNALIIFFIENLDPIG